MSIVPSYSQARSAGVDEIKAKLSDLSQDLDKFAPEHRNQVMVDRLRQQKLRAMISLAKAQQFLAETDVLIADYNLQTVADEFEHMKKERYNTDTRTPHNSELKEENVSSSDCPHPANIDNPKDISSCTPLVPAVDHSKSKEKGTELTPKLTTKQAEAHRSKSKTDASFTPTPEVTEILNKIRGSEPTTKINEPTSKVTKASCNTHEPTTSKARKVSSSKTKEAATSKTKEVTTSKTHEATTSTKEAAAHADTDLPAPELKSKKRKHSESKSKESKHSESKSKHSKRHKSSHKHVKSSYAPTKASDAPAESSRAPAESSLAPAASSNGHTALFGSAAPPLVPTASSIVPAAASFMPALSHVRTIISHAPNCDCVKSFRTDKEKTLLNTSISPIKKIVEAKGVQTDERTSEKDILQTDAVKTLTKGVQTDTVIILHVGSQTVSNPPDIADEDTLLLDTSPAPYSHSTAISLAKAFQQIKSQKTSVLERLCPTRPDSSFLSQNDVLQKLELIVEDDAETEESPAVVKMELPDKDLRNTSTEVLVNNLYQDIKKAKDKEIRRGMESKGKVTKRALWKVLDKC